MSPEVDQTVHADEELLAIAQEILAGEGFEVLAAEESDWPFLLAENAYFIIAVAATATVEQLLLAEDVVVAALSKRMSEVDLGPKAWDGYVILLTGEITRDVGTTTQQLFSVNYDTRSVRRIAHSGVPATLSGVRKALAPFVKPIELDDPLISQDPFEPFVHALIERKVPADLARNAVSTFRKGGSVDDVI